MPCTTILVGKGASYDGSTMTARTDDGFYDVKKLIVMDPAKQPRKYKSVKGHLEIDLPDNPLRYTLTPSVDPKEGIWPASGINSANVGMTATETITTNPRVLGADPMVRYKKAEKKGEKDIPGGIGEEDLCVLVLPYIRSAREGVVRLGQLLEKYGTYESNGIGFNDSDEIWWLETIGGHHWIARRVEDNEVVIMPNQLGIDSFDFDDAFGAQNKYMCSADLREFIAGNHLDLDKPGSFNPRHAFGSNSDQDHIYNTPRAWFMGRYLCPTTYKWEGDGADFTPESDNIPWSLVPEKKVTVEDVKYILSSYYQGTPYNPYAHADNPKKGIYRTIGINRTGVMCVSQIRPYLPEEIRSLQWVCFGSTSFDTVLPVYTDVASFPDYLSKVTLDVDTSNFYWSSRLLGALADPNYGACIAHIERYQKSVAGEGHRIINEYDRKMLESGDYTFKEEANKALCDMCRKQTTSTLNKVMLEASKAMKNGYNRADN